MRGTIRPAAFIERNEKSSRKDKEHDGISFDLYPYSKQGLESYDLPQPWPLRRPFTQLGTYYVTTAWSDTNYAKHQIVQSLFLRTLVSKRPLKAASTK